MLNFLAGEDPAELHELERTVRRFAEGNLRTPVKDEAESGSPQILRRDFAAMAALGLAGMSVGEEYGGTEIGALGIAASIFQLCQFQTGSAIYLSVHNMVAGLTQRWQKNGEHSEILSKLASGTWLGAFCLTEAAAGSDAAALKTKAEKNAGGYSLSGEKIYITSAGLADLYLIFARTTEDASRGISAFLVPSTAPGISFGPPEKKMGAAASPIATVTLKNCQVPASALLGAEGDGYKIALSGLTGGRVNIAAAACGLSARAIELARQHTKQRKQFGAAISEFQGVQFMLADMAIKHRAAVLLTRDAALQLNAGVKNNSAAAIAKCYASDSAMQTTVDAVQLFGGAGYLADYEAERLMREAKMLQIVEGTNQIQRIVIARALLE